MLDHGMKSIERFYINNFEDHVKQAAIDIVLGQQTGDLMSKYEETLASQLLEKRHEYIAFDNLKVGVVTWNVNSYHPNNDKLDLSELFSSFKDSNYTETPDIIAIGLQEVDNSAFNNLLNSEDGEKNEILWQNILKSNVNNMDTYYEISHLSYYGCFLIVFAKISLKERVKKIQFDEVNFSALANFSKKGALLIKFSSFLTKWYKAPYVHDPRIVVCNFVKLCIVSAILIGCRGGKMDGIAIFGTNIAIALDRALKCTYVNC